MGSSAQQKVHNRPDRYLQSGSHTTSQRKQLDPRKGATVAAEESTWSEVPRRAEHSKKEAGEWERELVRICKDDGKALPQTRVTGC